MSKSLRLFFDGASRGNPGISRCGVLLKDDSGITISKISRYLGSNLTNNLAEYFGLVVGLGSLSTTNQKINHLFVMGDSSLVINQMNGKYKCNNPRLNILKLAAEGLVKKISPSAIVYKHIPRSVNSEADQLCNESFSNFESKSAENIIFSPFSALSKAVTAFGHSCMATCDSDSLVHFIDAMFLMKFDPAAIENMLPADLKYSTGKNAVLPILGIMPYALRVRHVQDDLVLENVHIVLDLPSPLHISFSPAAMQQPRNFVSF